MKQRDLKFKPKARAPSGKRQGRAKSRRLGDEGLGFLGISSDAARKLAKRQSNYKSNKRLEMLDANSSHSSHVRGSGGGDAAMARGYADKRINASKLGAALHRGARSSFVDANTTHREVRLNSVTSLIAGFHAVQAVLKQAPEQLKQLFIATKINLTEAEQQLIAASGVSVARVEADSLTKMTGFMQHQGYVARVKPELTSFHPESLLIKILDKRDKAATFLVLDQVQDPHNLGACWRSANAFKIDAIIVPKDHTAPITPVVTKVSAGALCYPPIVAVTNLARCLQLLKRQGVWVYGVSEHAKSSLAEMPLGEGPVALIFGSEGSGIRPLVLKQCDASFKIPMLGSVPCLNVSVAVGVSLYALRQQRS